MRTNGHEKRRDGLPLPPFSTDLLVDFHAGVLDDALSAHIRDRLPDDPDGRRILAALEATSSDLDSLRDEEIPIPPVVRNRILRAIDDLSTD